MKIKYEWNLKDIYESKEKFDSDFKYIQDNMKNIEKYKGTLKDSSNNIYEVYFMLEKFELIILKLSAYSTLNFHKDMANSDNVKLYQEVESLLNKYINAVSFITPEMTNIEEEKLIKFLEENDKLKRYKRVIEKIIKDKKHVLSEKEELIISKFSPVLNSFNDIFDMLNDVDFKFGSVKNSNGEEVILTHSTYIKLLNDKDQKVRKEAFEKLYEVYKTHINTLSKVYISNVKKAIISASIRGYESSLQSKLDSEDSTVKVYDSLIETVNKNLYLNYRYMNLKKKLLNSDKLHMYDVYVNPLEPIDQNIEYDEACKIVKEALGVYGDEYISTISSAMEDGWIDVYEGENKLSGGYSMGIYGVHPYILLNYANDIESVSTLAHELGHTMHSYYSSKSQDYFNSEYTIMIAEVASTVNEILLSEYLIKNEKDKNKKASLVNSSIDRIRATLIRQTMFAEFEKIVHSKIEQSIPISSDDLSNIYFELNNKYFGDNVLSDEYIKYEWARVPHFYRPFYVYTYATGISSAIYIAKNILKNDKEYIEKYLEMLSLGGSKDSLELLKMVGVDLETNTPVQEAFNYFEEKLNELENLLGK